MPAPGGVSMICRWKGLMKERIQELKAAARRGPVAETLVRDARVCQGRQGRLLLPKLSGAGCLKAHLVTHEPCYRRPRALCSRINGPDAVGSAWPNSFLGPRSNSATRNCLPTVAWAPRPRTCGLPWVL